MSASFSETVRRFRRNQRWNQTQMGNAAGVTQATVSRWETAAQYPDGEQIIKLIALDTEYFGSLFGDMAFNSSPDSRLIPVPVIGAVEAGVFAETFEWSPEDQYTVYVPKHKDLSRYKRLQALEVVGRSMERHYHPGTIVVYASLFDHVEANPDIYQGFAGRELHALSGKRVVVRRTRNDDTYESTIKELIVDDDGNIWLWPRSGDPNHQQPVRLNGTPDIKEISVIGVIVSSIRIEN